MASIWSKRVDALGLGTIEVDGKTWAISHIERTINNGRMDEVQVSGKLLDPMEMDVPELKAAKYKTERQEQTITAWKRVNLKVVRNKIAIAGARADYVTHGSEARCITDSGMYGYSKTYAEHLAPDPECSCGFYGVKGDYLFDLDQQYGSLNYIVEIELSGTVIQHQKGYRAQHQRVMALYLGLCNSFLCRNEADSMVWHRNAGNSIGLTRCADHLDECVTKQREQPGSVVPLTKSELTERLGTEIRGIPEHMR